jgi:hypothetical protein
MKNIVKTILLFTGVLATTVAGGDMPDFKGQLRLIHPDGAVPRQGTMNTATAFDVATYHFGSSLYCSQCHVMHASAQHAVSSEPDPFGPFPRTFTPNDKLLKAADAVTLCLTCHDNQTGIPDVLGADVNGLADRSAGHFDAVGTDNLKGHKLAVNVEPESGGWELCLRCHFGGEFRTAAVTCIDCHNPHGNSRVRNLQWASDPGGERPFGMYVRSGSTGLARYETDNLGFPAPVSNEYREVSNMCKDCHHVMSGQMYVDVDDNGIHEKHPSYDSEYGSNGTNTIAQGDTKGSTSSAHWVAGTGGGFLVTPRVKYLARGATDFATSRTVAASNGVFCLSCHKAHGSDRSFALTWNPGGGGGEGCDQCHAKTEL